MSFLFRLLTLSPASRNSGGDRTSDYDFELPPHLIAQHPVTPRDSSRLMVVDRAAGTISHRVFSDLVSLIPAGDVLVVNSSRVVRARLLGKRDSGAPAEVFLLRALGDDRYEAMVHPGGKLRPGRRVHIADGLDVEILEITDRRTRIVRLHSPLPAAEAIERFGHVPLPPYIARADAGPDAELYQTVYATEAGSVAAPTAGLHFTPELLARLEARGVHRAEVVLHVGAGTFKPVEHEDPEAHVMHEEVYSISDAAAGRIEACRRAGGAVWGVGTTTVRALESAWTPDGTITRGLAETRIFIRPPQRIHAVDKLITNFHLPRSTLLMLVSAFAGRELVMRAYREAIDAEYRFYSFGDAMVIV
jgi:S-adenosylmethionine:tRNA ribosyltransferase-isomerase